jgi:hypothetical protein
MIPVDKQLHLFGGYSIAITVSIVYGPLVGFIVSSIIGILKEVVYDRFVPGHTVDKWDAIATAVGAAVGSCVKFLL